MTLWTEPVWAARRIPISKTEGNPEGNKIPAIPTISIENLGLLTRKNDTREESLRNAWRVKKDYLEVFGIASS